MNKENKSLINYVNYTKDGKYQEGDITVINDRLYFYVNGTFELINDTRFSDMPYLLIDKLQNNWNELKEFVEKEHIRNIEWYGSLTAHDKGYYLYKFGATKDVLRDVQDKMQEIESRK